MRWFLISLFVLGITSIITQVILLRETITTFYGNELFIGIVLAFWFIWVAVGSGILGKIFNNSSKKLLVLVTLHLAIGFCLFLEIFLVRVLKSWLGFPGEVPNLIYGFLFAALIPMPVSVILGMWWTLATQIFSSFYQGNETKAINLAYLAETIGFIAGGIVTSFLLVQLQEFLVATILILLNISLIPFLIRKEKGYFLIKILSSFLFVIFVFLIFSSDLSKLNQISANFRFRNQRLLVSTNSPYGNIAVTKINGQFNFYESGLLLGSTEDTEFSEYLVHLSLLQHPSPKKILLIGGGFTGCLSEILKHPVKEIYYLELDPKLIRVSQKYLTSELKKALSDRRVKIINMDAFYFLKKTKIQFDYIIINLPDPSTALLNRFYTREFFEEIRGKLRKGGILTTYLSFSPSAAGRNLENLNASLYKTLQKVFSEILILPEDINFFLASTSGNLTTDPQILIQRFKERKIKTKFFNTSYITYRLTNDRIKKTLHLFVKNKLAKENEMFTPIAYFYQILFWLDHFYLAVSKFFESFAFSFWWIFTGILVILSLFLISKEKSLPKTAPIFSMVIAGLSLMALEIIIIFAYQEIIGYLYYRISLLISAVTLGMALGVWYGNKKVTNLTFSEGSSEEKKPLKVNLNAVHANISLLKQLYRNLSIFHLFTILLSFLIYLAFLLLLKISCSWLTEVVFLFVSISTGILCASIFPFSNKLYLSLQKEPNKKTGTIYSADLIGASLGALLPSIILIPVFGVFRCSLLLSICNLWITLIYKYAGFKEKI